MLEVLAIPFVACVVLTGIHCYLGIHVVMRQVIFVDLALAQIAAMGAAVATLCGYPPHTPQTYAFAVGFTFIGAAVFAVGRFRDERVPQEAIIGMVYAVTAAVAILILSKSSFEQQEIEHMLVGRLLLVEWQEVGKTLLIYGAVAALHVACRRRFFAISASVEHARRAGINVRWWDFVFYASFGLVVTSSVQIAGVLLVFSFLVVPAVCAIMFFTTVRHRLLAGWALGLVASLMGLAASAQWDFPTGASVVASFGVLFLCCAATVALRALVKRHTTNTHPPHSAPRA
ncbi:MAG: metal ABC transporter permease [Phycisphaerae bacterium]